MRIALLILAICSGCKGPSKTEQFYSQWKDSSLIHTMYGSLQVRVVKYSTSVSLYVQSSDVRVKSELSSRFKDAEVQEVKNFSKPGEISGLAVVMYY